MRILHVMASRANGGAETYSADMMASLQAAGVEQVAVLPRASIHCDRLAAAGVPLAPDVLESRFGLLRRRKLAALIDSFKPDLVHCWMRRAASLMPPLRSRSSAGSAATTSRRISAAARTSSASRPASSSTWSSAVCRKPQRTTCRPSRPSRPVRRSIVAGSQPPPMRPCCSRCRGCTRRRGSTSSSPALAELPGCIAWIAGDGPLEAELKALAARLGVADRVRFLGWRTDRGALLAAADVCVLPSRWEPFGTVMLEAWAAGTPLVAAASQGPAALIRTASTASWCPSTTRPHSPPP